jgi:tetratricopeptide (TPR) repeat protein
MILGQLDGGEHSFQRVLVLAERMKDLRWKSIALGNLGLIYSRRGDLAKAEQSISDSVKIKEETGDKYEELLSIQNLGVVYQKQEKYRLAIQSFERVIAESKYLPTSDSNSLRASAEGNLGLLHFGNGSSTLAEVFLVNSLKLLEQIGDREQAARSLNNLGLLKKRERKFDQAEYLFTRSLEYARGAGVSELVISASFNIAVIYGLRDDARAQQLYEHALKLAEQEGAKPAQLKIAVALGLLYATEANLARATNFTCWRAPPHSPPGSTPSRASGSKQSKKSHKLRPVCAIAAPASFLTSRKHAGSRDTSASPRPISFGLLCN